MSPHLYKIFFAILLFSERLRFDANVAIFVHTILVAMCDTEPQRLLEYKKPFITERLKSPYKKSYQNILIPHFRAINTYNQDTFFPTTPLTFLTCIFICGYKQRVCTNYKQYNLHDRDACRAAGTVYQDG